MSPSKSEMGESEVRLVIRSTHPRVSAAELATDLAAEEQALNEHLRQKFPDVQVQVQREESFPVEWAVGYLLLKFIGGSVAAGFLKEIGSDAYRFLKERLKNGSLKMEESDEGEKGPEEDE